MTRLRIAALIAVALMAPPRADAIGVSVEPSAHGGPHGPGPMPKVHKSPRGCGCHTSDPASLLLVVLAVGPIRRRRRLSA